MAIDLDLLRQLAQKAELDAPFDISPTLPSVDISGIDRPNTDKPGTFSISISVPKNEGQEFTHWRYLNDLGYLRIGHDGRPGFGHSNNKVMGLTAKGQDFVELSRDDGTWSIVRDRCGKAGAGAMSSIVEELRKEARARIAAAKKK